MGKEQQPHEKCWTGGCQCGAVRFRTTDVIDDAHLCHCRMCQKAVGNVFAALVSAPKSSLRWMEKEPSYWQSSEQVWRGFCGHCGTPLCYDDRSSDNIGLMIGAFDRPAALVPRSQDGIEGRMPWLRALDNIPDGGITEKPEQAEWAERIRQSNRQHRDG
jgi:hypothetical protein